MASPGEELGRWARFARFQLHLWRFCARRLWENNVMAMSAALSFRTIFAMIPTIVLAILILKAVGVLGDRKERINQLLEASGFAQIALVEDLGEEAGEPTSQPADDSPKTVNLVDQIESLIAGVESKLTLGRVGPIGVVVLIWTVLTLLTTVERSLNRIFGARQSRALVRRVLLYWSVVTLIPVLLAAVAYVSQQTAETFKHTAMASWLIAKVSWAGHAMFGILVLAVVYRWLPNTAVRYRAALGGALVAVPLWLLAKWAFALYVRELVGTGNLYGALGLLPLFLLWLNLSWWIFLFGAELAHTAANLGRMRLAEQAERIVLGPLHLLAAAVAVTQSYLRGEGPLRFEAVAAKLGLPDDSVQWLLDRLTASNVVCPVETDMATAYVPARPAERIPVLEVLAITGEQQCSTQSATADATINDAIARVQGHARSSLGELTLAEAVIGRPEDPAAITTNGS
jgi:membrane protein